MTIKFVRIGAQLESGKDQFCFCFSNDKTSFVIEFMTTFGEPASIFNNWISFATIFNKCSKEHWYVSDYSLEDFKSLMPPEMLPKEEIKQEEAKIKSPECISCNLNFTHGYTNSNGDQYCVFCWQQKNSQPFVCNSFVEKQGTKPSDEIMNLYHEIRPTSLSKEEVYIDAIIHWLDRKFYEEKK